MFGMAHGLPWASMGAFAAGTRRSQFVHAYELFQAFMRLPGPPRFDLDAIHLDGQTVPVTNTVVAATPFCQLRRFSVPTASHRQQRMLCAPLAGHRAVVMREAIEMLVADGDVYVTDWVDARDVRADAGPFRLDDYVLMLERFMTQLGPASLDVVAVCQATVPALAAAARLAASGGPRLRALVLMGGPIDARLRPTALGRLAASITEPVFRAYCTGAVPSGYAGTGRNVYPGFLQLPTLATGEPDRLLAIMFDAVQCLSYRNVTPAHGHRAPANNYAAMMDLPAEFLLDTMRTVFQDFLLPRGLWRVGGALVAPAAMHGTRLLTVEGDSDTITGAGQTHAAHALCTGLTDTERATLTVRGCDHYGLFSGRPWRSTICPALRTWLEAPE